MMRSRARLSVPFSQPTLGRSEMTAPRPPARQDQSARAYPLKWIEDVFSSKERTESLLRPEVENGNVTYQDMELTQASDILLLTQTAGEITRVSFLSRSSRARIATYQWVFPSEGHCVPDTHVRSHNKSHPQLIYSNLAFLGTVVYSQRFARPKWNLTKLVTISTLLGFGSYTAGFNQKLAGHFRFARSLENPAGFNRALRNINTRLGGPEHFPYGVPERREELMDVALGPGVTALLKDSHANGPPFETTESEEGWAVQETDQHQSTSPYVITTFYTSFPSSAATDATDVNRPYTLIPFACPLECVPSHLNTDF